MSSPLLETYNRVNLTFTEGSGAWLKSSEGNYYLDMGSGIAVNSLGHANLELTKALTEQARKLWHTSNLYQIPSQIELATKLVDSTFAEKVFFTNSGTESIECAIKMARKYQCEKGEFKKTDILTFEGSFHGRSMAAISATGSEKLTKGFSPLLPGFKSLPFENSDMLDKLSFEDVCAILIEPIQGEGGIRRASKGFLKKLREICDRTGALLIFDEVQSGVGRTGLFFAFEHAEVSPDIVAVAKGIGGGFPIGCCMSSAKIGESMAPGSHGSTFGGNPLACAVGISVLEKIFSSGFLDSVSDKGLFFKNQLHELVKKNPSVFGSVRGVGLMLGLKCIKENISIVGHAQNNKLLVVPGGDNVIRILPPLNITYDEIEEAIRRLTKSASDATGDK